MKLKPFEVLNDLVDDRGAFKQVLLLRVLAQREDVVLYEVAHANNNVAVVGRKLGLMGD